MRFRRRHAATIGIVLGVLVPLATALAITLYPSAPANASKQKGYNGEGTVAVNPADPLKVFASFNNHSDVSQWRRSTDGGRNPELRHTRA